MKNLILIIAICLSGISAQAQYDLIATGEFQPSSVQVGQDAEFVLQITNFTTETPNPVPAEGSSVTIIVGAGSEVNAASPPVGADGDKYTWTFLGETIGWYGVSTTVMPFATLYEVRVPVTATIISANGSTYNTDIIAPNSDVLPNNDTGVATLIVTMMLPVEFTSFDVESKDCATADLTWETALEVNNAGFHIERSISGGDKFETVGFVRASDAGKSGATYNFQDDIRKVKDQSETIYYRLRQVDLDGTEDYSDVVSVKMDCEIKLTVSGYPNPVINQYNLEVQGEAGSNKVIIMNEQNQMIESFTAQRNTEYPIKMQAYQSGVYTVSVLDAGGNVIETKKVIKITN